MLFNGSNMIRITAALLFGWLCGLPAFAEVPGEKAAGVGKWIPPTFAAAVVVEPARLEKAAAGVGLPVESLWRLVESTTGLDPRTVERFTLLVDPLPGGNVAFFPAVVARFPADAEAKKQLAPLLGKSVVKRVRGNKTYLLSSRYKMAGVEIAGFAADDRTLLFGPWPSLVPMLDPNNERGALAKLAAAEDLDHDLVVALAARPVQDKITRLAALRIARLMPSPLEPAWEVFKHLDTAVLRVDLAAAAMVRAEFRAFDKGSAAAVHEAVKRGLATAKEMYAGVRPSLAQLLPAGVAPRLTLLLDAAVNNAVVTADGKTVIVTVARPNALNLLNLVK